MNHVYFAYYCIAYGHSVSHELRLTVNGRSDEVVPPPMSLTHKITATVNVLNATLAIL